MLRCPDDQDKERPEYECIKGQPSPRNPVVLPRPQLPAMTLPRSGVNDIDHSRNASSDCTSSLVESKSLSVVIIKIDLNPAVAASK